MKRLIMLLMSIMAIAVFSLQTLAGETMMGKDTSGMMESRNYTPEQLIGLNVNNLKGKHVGIIRDVNLNSETGEINYVILGKSLLGIGEEKFAVPLEILKNQNDERNASATLIISESRLLNAPTIATGESDEEFSVRLQRYYCDAPEFEGGVGGLKVC